jgi:hypothetical protein
MKKKRKNGKRVNYKPAGFITEDHEKTGGKSSSCEFSF